MSFSFKNLPLLLATGAFGFISSVLMREYKTGGIKAHHLLNQKDMPALSNLWGLLLLPLLGWMAGYFLRKRIFAREAGSDQKKTLIGAALSFAGALSAGYTLSWLFLHNKTDLLEWVPLLFLGIALLLPVYRGEYVLGFVIGMTVTFGPVIPVLFGAVFAGISALVQLILLPKLGPLFKRKP